MPDQPVSPTPPNQPPPPPPPSGPAGGMLPPTTPPSGSWRPTNPSSAGWQSSNQPPVSAWRPTNPPAPPAPKRSWFAQNKLLTGCLILIVGFVGLVFLVMVAVAMSGGSSETARSPSTASPSAEAGASASSPEASAEPSQTPEEPAAPGLGTPVRDGKFEFTVTAVEDGGTEVGGEFLKEQAQGTFRLVHVTVTNIGTEPQTLFDSNQKIIDDQGRSFEPNSTAGLYLDSNQNVWITPVNPGNTVTGILVFDMPTDATPVAIELHDSAFSGGVTVSLQ